jgi:hypothetical protein
MKRFCTILLTAALLALAPKVAFAGLHSLRNVIAERWRKIKPPRTFDRDRSQRERASQEYLRRARALALPATEELGRLVAAYMRDTSLLDFDRIPKANEIRIGRVKRDGSRATVEFDSRAGVYGEVEIVVDRHADRWEHDVGDVYDRVTGESDEF